MAVSHATSGGGSGGGTNIADFNTTENQRTYTQSTTGINAGSVTIHYILYDTSGTVLADTEWTTSGSDLVLNFDPRADGIPVYIHYSN